MGGRMSGESPREEKIDVLAAITGDEVANQRSGIGGDTAAPTVERQRSRQQLIPCWPLGQHESCDASEWVVVVVWQSVDINGEIAANAVREPCRPMTIIRIRTTSSRFIPQSLTGTANRCKPSPRGEA
jgi:hypothetical protein